MKKAYLHTFGCKVNQYETQLFRESLARDGYEVTDHIGEADLIFVNSCTVTGEADRQCRQLLRRLTRENVTARILVGGCYAVRGAAELRALSERIEVWTGRQVEEYRAKSITRFSDHARAFIKVQDGCDAFCSYCIVPYVRPVLRSRAPDEIAQEVASLVAQGCPEIVLSGVRLGKYDGGLPALLRMLGALSGTFRMRLSSLEINEVSPELVELMAREPQKICAHLHLPLQSGSDTVLRRMNRPYASAAFAERLAGIRALVPEAGFSTDVIVGFPGETDREFEETYRFIERQEFSRLHVFTFSPRSGTPAAAMPDRPPREVVQERSRLLRELDACLQERFWRRWIGTRRWAVSDGDGDTVITDNYVRLHIGNNPQCRSSLVPVHIGEKGGKPWGDIETGRGMTDPCLH
jgi:threonylcarbamoyladenosine tRNA methylthiotransferase MtaB